MKSARGPATGRVAWARSCFSQAKIPTPPTIGSMNLLRVDRSLPAGPCTRTDPVVLFYFFFNVIRSG